MVWPTWVLRKSPQYIVLFTAASLFPIVARSSVKRFFIRKIVPMVTVDYIIPRMNRRVLITILLLALTRGWADTDLTPTENGERGDETTFDQEWESKGVIPHGGLTLSTQAITPIAILPDRNPYDQALEELTQAQDL